MEPIQPTANHINVQEATKEQLIELTQVMRQELHNEKNTNADLSKQMTSLRDFISEKNDEVSTLKNTNASLTKKMEALRGPGNQKSTSPMPRSDISAAEVSTTTASSSSEATGTGTGTGTGAGATPATPLSPLLVAKNGEIAKLEAKVRELMEVNAFYTAIVAQHDIEAKQRHGQKEPTREGPQGDGEEGATVAARQQIEAQERKIEKLQRLMRQMERERSQQDNHNQTLKEEVTRLRLEMTQVEKWQQAAQEKLRLQMASNKLVEDIRASSEALHTPVSAPRSKTTSMTPLQRRKLLSVSPAPTESPSLARSPLLDDYTAHNISYGGLTAPSAHKVDFSKLPPVNIRNPGPKERELLRRMQLYEKYVAEQVAFEEDRQRRLDEMEHSRAELFANMNEEIKKQKREIMLLKKEEGTGVRHDNDGSAAEAIMCSPEKEKSAADKSNAASSLDVLFLRLCLEEAAERALVVRQQSQMYINVVHLHERAITHHLLGALARAVSKGHEAEVTERSSTICREEKLGEGATEKGDTAVGTAGATAAAHTLTGAVVECTEMLQALAESQCDCANAFVQLRGECMNAYNALVRDGGTARRGEISPPPAAMIESELAEVCARIARLKATSAAGSPPAPIVGAVAEEEEENHTNEKLKRALVADEAVEIAEFRQSRGPHPLIPEGEEAPNDRATTSPELDEETPASSSSEPLQPPPLSMVSSTPSSKNELEAHVDPTKTVNPLTRSRGEEGTIQVLRQRDNNEMEERRELKATHTDEDIISVEMDTPEAEKQSGKEERRGPAELTAEEEALLLQLEEPDDEDKPSSNVAPDRRKEQKELVPRSHSMASVHEVYDAAAPAAAEGGTVPLIRPGHHSDEPHMSEEIPLHPSTSSTSSSFSQDVAADIVPGDCDGSDEDYLPAEEITITAFETTPPPSTLRAASHGLSAAVVLDANPYAVMKEMQVNQSMTTPSSTSSSEMRDRLRSRAAGETALPQAGPPRGVPLATAAPSMLAPPPPPYVNTSSSAASDSDGSEFQAEFDPFA